MVNAGRSPAVHIIASFVIRKWCIMGNVVVHPRVTERHPELAEDDVRFAWNNYVRMARRAGTDDYYLAVGFDEHGRGVEMVAVETIDGDWFVYHAYTPPTKSFMRELNMMR